MSHPVYYHVVMQSRSRWSEVYHLSVLEEMLVSLQANMPTGLKEQ